MRLRLTFPWQSSAVTAPHKMEHKHANEEKNTPPKTEMMHLKKFGVARVG